MKSEPRHKGDYSDRQVEAARRVIIDLGQVLASFRDAMVVVGGWVPDLLLPDTTPRHVGSIDVDLALDAAKLGDGRYADLVGLLFATGRYERGAEDFQLVTTVDLGDGEDPINVTIEFMASADVRMDKNRPKLVEDFRILRFPAFAAAFEAPENIEMEGPMISGALNKVRVRVASLSGFIIMKAHAVAGRDKPKDVYDLCYCLEATPNTIDVVAADWQSRRQDPLVVEAVAYLRDKFKSVEHYGPQQLAVFYDSPDDHESAMHARRGFELVQKFLRQISIAPQEQSR